MDSKVRIHFFPRDSSRVRVISFSRMLGIVLLCISIPMCLLGFWLFLTGVLREDPNRRVERLQDERENRVLRAKISRLRDENVGLTQSMDSLESARYRALMASGMMPSENNSTIDPSQNFGFLRLGRPGSSDELSKAVGKSRQTALFLDSAIFVLARNPELTSQMPTFFPLDPEALVIRPYGISSDPFTGRRSLHPGVDFSLKPGALIYAAGGGKVISTSNDPLWGFCIRIRHSDKAETFYAHLQHIRVRLGELIERGQVIGTLGQSGVSSGPHLHFEMMVHDERVDPLRYLFPRENPSKT